MILRRFFAILYSVLVNANVSEKSFNVQTIKEIVSAKEIDLIIMGTCGAGLGISKKLFGSNTSAIIEDSGCPILSIPLDYKYSSINKIAYASNLSDISKEIGYVIDFGTQFNASIEVFHVTPIFPDLGDVEKKDVFKIVDELKVKHQYPNINYYVERTSHDNEIKKAINLFIMDYNPDMLVLFHSNRNGVDKVITSGTTGTIASNLQIPLLAFLKNN
jgi:nucleotide-binding universal stress UspA family protein